MPSEIIIIELAEFFKLDPREVEQWDRYELNKWATIVNAKRAGEEYKKKLQQLRENRKK